MAACIKCGLNQFVLQSLFSLSNSYFCTQPQSPLTASQTRITSQRYIVEPTYTMLHTRSQDHSFFGPREEGFIRGFTFYGHGSHFCFVT